jgi:hypothetical protein
MVLLSSNMNPSTTYCMKIPIYGDIELRNILEKKEIYEHNILSISSSFVWSTTNNTIFIYDIDPKYTPLEIRKLIYFCLVNCFKDIDCTRVFNSEYDYIIDHTVFY